MCKWHEVHKNERDWTLLDTVFTIAFITLLGLAIWLGK